MASSFDDQIKKYVGQRDWSSINLRSVEYIPFILVPGAPPPSLADHIDATQGEVVKQLVSNEGPIYDLLPGVRSIVIAEGIFLLHKALHLLGNAESHAREGIKTWALYEGYQSSFFAIQSIMAFLGLSKIEIQNKTFLVDIWPAEIRLRNKPRQQLTRTDNELIQVTGVNNKIEHRHLWLLFQRLVRVATVKAWPENLLWFFKNVDTKVIPRQRNAIQYHNHKWLFDDCYSFINDPGFGASLESLDEFNENGDFSFVLGMVLLKMAKTLFDDMCANTEKLNAEKDLVKTAFESSRFGISNLLLTNGNYP